MGHIFMSISAGVSRKADANPIGAPDPCSQFLVDFSRNQKNWFRDQTRKTDTTTKKLK